MSGSRDPMEAAILQGIDAHPTSSYREDRRAAQDSDADDAPNTDDQLDSDLPDDEHDLYYNNDDDDQHQHASSSAAAAGGSEREGGIKGLMSSRTAKRGGEGASKTGPKGVLRDQQLRAQQESAARSAAVHATNRRMEGLALSSETYTQQAEREKREQAARLRRENADSDDDDVAVSQEAIADLQAKERRREMRIAELKSYNAARNSALVSGNPASAVGATVAPPTAAAGKGASNRWFGHLREVDERGYVSAIDIEHADVPIVIHIYSKAVAQCNVLTASLASLARQYPRTKFLQVQAAAIGFGKSANTDDGEDDEEEYDEYNPKTLEVLPTVLVYKAGTLVANLVRVDLDPMWKHGREQDVRDLLDSYDALAGAVGAAGATVAPASDRNDQGDDDD
ncbi:hypothetical protein NDA11_003742 [Ustilago hordei]|uniref:Related to Phosducin n=1 Tax=Ustilago hordei TaxID=120017 RepID=I2FRS0_USTHO|nr:uncharacterized protein UHO2_06931 [Ustilago hordei]KAJ1045004.1 hypothetical protein NDA10_005150 [Ustilago hordei]KAJ1572006.1 hypothetical protein NDA15_002480 [Ustilago hordei]KAJ1573513.1 hypothetical protein NDA11_003742 [Ustilago hordei]KAJ1594406.1 hypothetical protein NDA12_002845 [Ustilago hordei]UTT92690.1 hypothetical protein NDA17_007301 [Ustilago hordei]